jgi:hypothetical protein
VTSDSIRRAIGCIVALAGPALVAVHALRGQTPPTCPPDQAATFRFLIGTWRGVVYDLTPTDSAISATARVSATPLFDGCALEERWHFEKDGVTEVDAFVLRAIDLGSLRWSYDIATSHAEHVTYRGEQDGRDWRFTLEAASDGKRVRVRITWVPTATGYSEQIARSWDQGKSWRQTRHINFMRADP